MVGVIDIKTGLKKYIKISEFDPSKHEHYNKGKKWSHSKETLIKMSGVTTAKTLCGSFIKVHKDDPRFKNGKIGADLNVLK
jgi:hypothetical protein